jgi:DNA repair exonuclease SbcCD ATPase subunit
VVLEDLRKEKSKLLDSARDVINEYRTKYPELQNELYTLKDILEKTGKFKNSVNFAIENLENISSESYKNWAEILNKNVNVILNKINRNYEDLKFDSDLSFTVKPKGLDIICSQKEINYQLSSGARDQIYLSVRLALGKYFSKKGIKLPFIMDDPFVTSDDIRFIDGMKFIISELAKEHQVILLTCHKKRHEYLKSTDSKWFDDNIEVCFLKKIN